MPINERKRTFPPSPQQDIALGKPHLIFGH
jgi:hypothetical protein